MPGGASFAQKTTRELPASRHQPVRKADHSSRGHQKQARAEEHDEYLPSEQPAQLLQGMRDGQSCREGCWHRSPDASDDDCYTACQQSQRQIPSGRLRAFHEPCPPPSSRQCALVPVAEAAVPFASTCASRQPLRLPGSEAGHDRKSRYRAVPVEHNRPAQ